MVVKNCWHSLIPVNVLPKSACTEYTLEATSKSQSGVGFKGANGSHIKHYGQRRFRVKTSAGSNMNTTWEVADVRKPVISRSRLLEKGFQEGFSRRVFKKGFQEGFSRRVFKKGSQEGFSRRVLKKGSQEGFSRRVFEKGSQEGFSRRVLSNGRGEVLSREGRFSPGGGFSPGREVATAFRAECHPRVQDLAAAHAAEMNEESILRPEMAKNIACHCGRQVAPGAGAPCPWSCAVTFCSSSCASSHTLVCPWRLIPRAGVATFLPPASPGWSWPLQQLGVLIHPVCATILAHRDLSSSGALLSEALPLEAREAAWELWHSPSAWISYVEHRPVQSGHSRCRLNFRGLNFSCARSLEQRHALWSNPFVKGEILALSVHGTLDAHLWGLPRRSLLRH